MYQKTLDTAALAWSPTGWPGVWMKVLQQGDLAGGGMSGMMRMEPGSTVKSIPAHRHTHADQTVFVIEGDLVEAGVTYGPGRFLLAKAPASHGPHASPGGCVLLSTYFGTPDFVAVP